MKKVLFSVYFGLTVLVLSAGEGVHTVKPGESLYSIARQYNVSVTELKNLNTSLQGSANIKAGQKLVVSGTPATTVKKATAMAPATVPAKVHVVNKGETFYAICKKYGVTAAEVKQWNQLSDLNVRIGQRLVVSKANSVALYKPISVPSTPDTPYREEDVRPRFSTDNAELAVNTPDVTEPVSIQPVVPQPKPVVTSSLRTSSNNYVEYPGIFNQYPTYGYKIRKSKGAANYMEDATSGNQNLAFYSNAETGSVIRVTNLMNHKTIYVKVVGKVPPADAASEVTIKLSNKAAKDLGAIDEKFLVEVASYSAVN